jgi:hypothetical protein
VFTAIKNREKIVIGIAAARAMQLRPFAGPFSASERIVAVVDASRRGLSAFDGNIGALTSVFSVAM